MKRIFALLCALCLLCAGCAQDAPDPSEPEQSAAGTEDAAGSDESPAELIPLHTLDAVLAFANARHRAIGKPAVNLLDYIAVNEESDFDIRRYETEWVYDGELPLSLEQAEADLDVLFEALRTTYGPYHYFGGDAAFDAAQEAILTACAALDDADGLTCRDLHELLLEHLDFIWDAHFSINGFRLHQPQVPYFYPAVSFRRAQDGSFVAADGRTLDAVDGWADPEELLRLTLGEGEAGELVYLPVVLREVDLEDLEQLPEDLTLRFRDGSEQTVSAEPWASYYEWRDEGVELTWRDGVPVIYCRTMGFDGARDDVWGQAFLDLIDEVREEPVVILDLRSNGGGNGVLPFKWLSEWTGQAVTTNMMGLQYWSEQDMLDYVADTENPAYASYEDFTGLLGMTPVTDQYMSLADVPDMFAEHEQILIVLTGKNTVSAGEYFADAAMNVENVLVVGENTYGMVRSNAYTTMVLPGSGVAVQLGCNLMLFPEGQFEEFVGIQPDIWVRGDAEELVFEMLAALS